MQSCAISFAHYAEEIYIVVVENEWKFKIGDATVSPVTEEDKDVTPCAQIPKILILNSSRGFLWVESRGQRSDAT